MHHIVRPYARLVWENIPEQFSIAPQCLQDSCIEKAITTIYGKYVSYEDRWNHRRAFDQLRRSCIIRYSDEWNQNEYCPLVAEYETLLNAPNVLDFYLLTSMGFQILREHEWVRRVLNAKFPAILIDEYQDLGEHLHEMVLSLCFNGSSRLFAVGDPDQSIYGFTGACPERMKELTQKTELVKEVRLRMNYRSHKKIITGSSAALEQQHDFDFYHNEEGTVRHYSIPDGFESQIRYAFKEILPAALTRREGRKLGDIGVLYCDKHQGGDVAKILDEEFQAYQYVRFDGGRQYQKNQLTMWLEDCAAWCSEGNLSGKILLGDLIQHWMNFFTSQKKDSEVLQCRKELVKFLMCKQNQNPNYRLQEWLHSFKEFGLYHRLKSESFRTDEFEALEKLYRLCQDGEKFSQYTVEMLGRQKGSPEHLNLTTIHSAKGLEYDVVIMLGLERGILPHWNVQNINEQRRLFYVAMTRARHEVHLLSSGWYADRNGKPHNDGHSPFIDDVLHQLDAESWF